MKKAFIKPKYKRWHNKKSKKLHKRSKKKRKVRLTHRNQDIYSNPLTDNNVFRFGQKDIVYAPLDFRLLINTDECLRFFLRLRDQENFKRLGSAKYIRMSLRHVEEIDYASISILAAIHEEFTIRGIILHGDFTKKEKCNKLLIESGYTEHISDLNGKRFPTVGKSDLFTIEKGTGALKDSESLKISKVLAKVSRYVTPALITKQLRTLVLEICGNSIEWSESNSKMWLMGVIYEQQRIYFTLTDLGKGILETLNIKATEKAWDYFRGKSSFEVLDGAFDKEYGSSSKEINRNKGLPYIKKCFESGVIENLKVITNDVILNFGNQASSEVFGEGVSFMGTFYQWELKIS